MKKAKREYQKSNLIWEKIQEDSNSFTMRMRVWRGWLLKTYEKRLGENLVAHPRAIYLPDPENSWVVQ